MEQNDKRVGVKNFPTGQKNEIVHRSQNHRPLKAGSIGSDLKRWRWYNSPDLYQYQHVSDVRLFNFFALFIRQETRKCWYKSGDLHQRQGLSPARVNLKCCCLSFIEKIQAIRRLYSPLGVGGSEAKVNFPIIGSKSCQWIANGLFIFLLLLSSCATREEGCNDALANNFDLAADKPCDGCCEYPGVRIRLTHKYGSAAVVYNQAIFSDGSGNPFGFRDLRFYLSNIQVISVGNKVIDVQEPLDVYVEKTAGDTLKTSIPNSFGLARGLGQADMYIQSYRDTATINRIRFTVGVNGEMNQANPLRLPSDHPLRSSVYDGMYLGAQNGYVFTRVLYYAKDNVDVKISGSANLRTVEVSFNPIKLQRGYNLNVLMDVDYARWFQNVNVNSDAPAQISQKILQNLGQSFKVTAVSTGL